MLFMGYQRFAIAPGSVTSDDCRLLVGRGGDTETATSNFRTTTPPGDRHQADTKGIAHRLEPPISQPRDMSVGLVGR